MIDLRLGDCCEFEDAGLFHALLCDPPYELGFMGRAWDKSGIAFDPETWAKLAEHLYDGAFGMAFASSRGWHRLACAIEDAGLIIHPSIFGWAYGSGFPKATRIDTAIDKVAGAKRGEKIRKVYPDGKTRTSGAPETMNEGWDRPWRHEDKDRAEFYTLPATPLAATWAGHRYGLQALKPALEPIIVFQKPYRGKPIECITRTGAGALWIDGARIGIAEDLPSYTPSKSGLGKHGVYGQSTREQGANSPTRYDSQGRWPANFILLDDDAAQALDAQSGELVSRWGKASGGNSMYTNHNIKTNVPTTPNDSGGASRFFFRVQEQIDDADPVYYTAKASRRERDAGLDGFPEREYSPDTLSAGIERKNGKRDTASKSKTPFHNVHPTVKPIALARYLATLLLPPAEYAPRRILVPFAGVGSEMIGAHLAGWDEVIGIERGAEYVEIGQARIAHWCGIPIEAQAQLTMVMA